MNHMSVIDGVCDDVSYGFGRRVFAVKAALMKSAPESLISLCAYVLGRDILSSDKAEFKELSRQWFNSFELDEAYAVFYYKDSEEKLSFKAANEFAKSRNMRLFTRAEAEWLARTINYGFPQEWYWTNHRDSYDRAMAVTVSLGFVGLCVDHTPQGVRCLTLGDRP